MKTNRGYPGAILQFSSIPVGGGHAPESPVREALKELAQYRKCSLYGGLQNVPSLWRVSLVRQSFCV